MTKKLALAGLLAASIAGSAAHADLLRVSAFGGYTTLSLQAVNDNMDKGSASLKGSGYTADKDSRMSGGYLAGLEVGSGLLIPIPLTELVARGEVIGASAEYSFSKSAALPYTGKSDAVVTNALLGLSVAVTPPLSPLGVSLAAYGGYGYAVIKSAAVSGGSVSNNQYTGGGLMGELEARLKFKPIPMIGLDLFGGMRFENIASITDGNNTSKDFNGKDLAYDFGGFDGGAAIDIGF